MHTVQGVMICDILIMFVSVNPKQRLRVCIYQPFRYCITKPTPILMPTSLPVPDAKFQEAKLEMVAKKIKAMKDNRSPGMELAKTTNGISRTNK